MTPKEVFQWETLQRERVTIIKPRVKEITYKNSKIFYQRVKELLSQTEAPRIILDLGGVDVIDSRSLGIFVSIYKHVKQKNGEIALACLTPPVMELFNILNFNHVFHWFDTIEDAERSLTQL